MNVPMLDGQTATTWIEVQQQTLVGWLDAWLEADGMHNGTLWRCSVETWQASVKAALEAHNRWVHAWTDAAIHAPATPEVLRSWAQLSLQQLDWWTQAQEQVWEQWLGTVRDMQPASITSPARQNGKQVASAQPSAGIEAGQSMVQLWRNWMRGVLDTQAEWTRRWMESAGNR